MSSEPTPPTVKPPTAPELLEQIREALGANPRSAYWRNIQSELIQLFRLGYTVVPPRPLSTHYVQDNGQGEDYYWSRCVCGEYFTALYRAGIQTAEANHQFEERTA